VQPFRANEVYRRSVLSQAEEASEKYLEELLETGSGVAGSVAGTAIGLAMGGPPGAFAGAVGGPIVARTTFYLAREFKHRVLGMREEERIGATMAFVIKKIQENVAKGEQIRQNGFFRDRPNQRAAAKEVGEGVFLAAQREHEEKKLPFYGNLLANIAFDPSISREQVNLLVKEGQTLSYRQLCVLAFVAAKLLFEGKGFSQFTELRPIPGLEADVFQVRQGSFQDIGGASDRDNATLLHEIFDLDARNLVSTGTHLAGSTYVDPSKLRLVLLGFSLYRLMELWEINAEDVRKMASLLR
jgi:hypothetical protein